MTILDQIFDHKRAEVSQRQGVISLASIRHIAEGALPALDFLAVLQRPPTPALIAEIKHASPSRGLLRADFDPLSMADIYQRNGARAVSILTDEQYFQGSLEHLRQVRSKYPDLPLLQKDFIFDRYQLYEARAAGADAVLLIATWLDPLHLADLYQLSSELGMAALVEVHTIAELDNALRIKPRLIGINNRDLYTFEVDIANALALLPHVPLGITVVAESGIRTRTEVEKLVSAGIHAFLVGESIITSADPGAKVRELFAPVTAPGLVAEKQIEKFDYANH